MASEVTQPEPIKPLPEFAGILQDNESFSQSENDPTSERINSWFDNLMVQAGLDIPPAVILSLCMFAGLVLGGLVFVIQENMLAAAIATFLGFALPIVATVIARSRRQTKMMDQLPSMIDELARAAKTGRSLDQCYHMVADDTPNPLGKELQLCARKVQMGVNLSNALQGLPQRTGLMTLNIFVTALSVHEQTGGDLVRVLERLSHTIRDRILFLGRLRAATIASRATAVLMIVIPPAIVTFFTLRDANYMTDLTNSTWGRTLVMFAILLQIIGTFWVLRILKQSQRT